MSTPKSILSAFKQPVAKYSVAGSEYEMPTMISNAYMPLSKEQCGLVKGRHWKNEQTYEDCYGNLWYMPAHCAKGSQCATKEDRDAMKAKCLKAASLLDKNSCKILGNRWIDVDGVAIMDPNEPTKAVLTNGLCMPTHCNFTEECKERKIKCAKKCSKRRSGSRKRRAARRTSRK